MIRFRHLTIAAIALAIGIAAPSAHAADPSVLNVDSLLSTNLLGDTQELRTDKIEGDSLSSVYLTQVRGEMKAHSHLHHKETVYLVRGSGRLTLGVITAAVKIGERTPLLGQDLGLLQGGGGQTGHDLFGQCQSFR